MPPATKLLQTWYGDGAPPWWARVLEPAYRATVRMRRAGYARGWLSSGHPGQPVVIVGNLTAGGAGKTPLVTWLATELAGRGMAPAVVSRGYGGAEPRSPHQVLADDDPRFCGDEPLLIARRSGRPVWICRDRLAAARAAVAAGADLVIADDGLQHYRLARDFEILVIDAERGFGNGRCLPAGPLREPLERAAEVDFTVCNGRGSYCPSGSAVMALSGAEACRLDGVGRRALEDFAGEPVHAVAGIGHPERFFRHLRSFGLEVIPHALPDHAPVPPELFAPADGLEVLMTEKDAMRCAGVAAAAHAWQVPVTARFADEGRALLGALAKRLGLGEA